MQTLGKKSERLFVFSDVMTIVTMQIPISKNTSEENQAENAYCGGRV